MDTAPSNSMRPRDSPPGWPRTLPPSSHIQPGPHETGVWIHQAPSSFLSDSSLPSSPYFTDPPTLPGPGTCQGRHLGFPFPGKCTTRNHCGIKLGWFKTSYRLPWLVLLGWWASSSLFFLFPWWPAFPAQSYIFPSVCACCSVEGREKRHSRGQVIVARTGLENPHRARTQGKARA